MLAAEVVVESITLIELTFTVATGLFTGFFYLVSPVFFARGRRWRRGAASKAVRVRRPAGGRSPVAVGINPKEKKKNNNKISTTTTTKNTIKKRNS